MPWLNGSGSERTAVFRLLSEFVCVGFHHGLINEKAPLGRSSFQWPLGGDDRA
jgi:hypothetical protein